MNMQTSRAVTIYIPREIAFSSLELSRDDDGRVSLHGDLLNGLLAQSSLTIDDLYRIPGVLPVMLLAWLALSKDDGSMSEDDVEDARVILHEIHRHERIRAKELGMTEAPTVIVRQISMPSLRVH